MEHGQRHPGGISPRQANGIQRVEEGLSRLTSRSLSESEDGEIERARHRTKAFQDKIQEGDEGQGEWESSVRSW